MNIQHQNLLQEKENDLLKEDEIRVEQELGKGQRIKMNGTTRKGTRRTILHVYDIAI